MKHLWRSQARGGGWEQAQLASQKRLEGGQLRSDIIGQKRILIIAAVNQIPMLRQVGRSVIRLRGLSVSLLQECSASRLRHLVEQLGRSTEVASHYQIGSKVGPSKDAKKPFSVDKLLVTVPLLFPPDNALVEDHPYFTKWKAIDEDAFKNIDEALLKGLLKRGANLTSNMCFLGSC